MSQGDETHGIQEFLDTPALLAIASSVRMQGNIKTCFKVNLVQTNVLTVIIVKFRKFCIRVCWRGETKCRSPQVELTNTTIIVKV